MHTKTIVYEIKITQYPLGQLKASGSIIRELSLNAGVEGDIEILLSKNNIYKRKYCCKTYEHSYVLSK